MKICNQCNAQLDDAAAFCSNCGAAFMQQPAPQQPAPQQPCEAPQQAYYQQPYVAPQQPCEAPQQAYYQQPYVAPQQPRVSGLATAAKILMIISTVVMGLYLIPLAWCLPMVISYSKKLKNNQPVSTGFKICTLLFVNTIAGILMLCDKD